MIRNIIWILTGINALALLIVTGAYFYFSGKPSVQQVHGPERDWMGVLLICGLLIVLLSAIPLRYGHSGGWTFFAGFFAILPLLAVGMIYFPDIISSFKKEKTLAETYYSDKTQRQVANAIQANDTLQLKELIKGQNLNIQGTRVWDWEGLSYLQFAVRIRPNFNAPDKATNLAIIRILVENGSAPTPALAEAATCLSPGELLVLLDAGADPNTSCFIGGSPLLFQVIGDRQNEIALLLIKKGANINSLNRDQLTPVMAAANDARTGAHRQVVWQLVRYLLEEAHADYEYTSKDGISLATIITNIQKEARENNTVMPADFYEVVKFLEKKKVLAPAV